MNSIRSPKPALAIQWTEEMESGIAEIDVQHRHLVALTNAVVIGHGLHSPALVQSTLSELRAYVAEHFAAEERWMQSLGYATFAEHAREHHKISDYVEDLWACRATLAAENLFEILADWIYHHVAQESAELRLISMCN